MKLSALSPRYEARQPDAGLGRALSAHQAPGRCWPPRPTSTSPSTPRRPTGWSLSLKLLERLARRAGAGRLDAASASRCRPTRSAAPAGDRGASPASPRASGRRLMVRLVKGAYWDTEIKRAQVAGRPDYPVYTTKAATDLSYLVCARALIGAAPALYGQFATHNAHTLAAVRAMAEPGRAVAVEYQRLHGMGEALYAGADDALRRLPAARLRPGRRPRGPAALSGAPPAGERRQHLLRPRPAGRAHAGREGGRPTRSPRSRPPAARRTRASRCRAISTARAARTPAAWTSPSPRRATRWPRAIAALPALDAGPIVGGKTPAGAAPRRVSPCRPAADRRPGRRRHAGRHRRRLSPPPRKAQPAWDDLGGEGRAPVLRAMADALEADRDRLIAICAREAGKTLADGVAEVREAADFCRYYAAPGRAPVRRAGDPARARSARPTSWSCTAAASSPASARGTSRWPSSPARSPRRWPPATRCWPSPPSRPR